MAVVAELSSSTVVDGAEVASSGSSSATRKETVAAALVEGDKVAFETQFLNRNLVQVTWRCCTILQVSHYSQNVLNRCYRMSMCEALKNSIYSFK